MNLESHLKRSLTQTLDNIERLRLRDRQKDKERERENKREREREIYIYIYRERENREVERQGKTKRDLLKWDGRRKMDAESEGQMQQ